MLNKTRTDATADLPSDIHWASAWQLREAIVTKRLSAVEVAKHFMPEVIK